MTRRAYSRMGQAAEFFEDELGNIPLNLLEETGESAGLLEEAPAAATAFEAGAALGGPMVAMGAVLAGGAFLAYEELMHHTSKRHIPQHLEDHTLDEGGSHNAHVQRRMYVNKFKRATPLWRNERNKRVRI